MIASYCLNFDGKSPVLEEQLRQRGAWFADDGYRAKLKNICTNTLVVFYLKNGSKNNA